MTKVELGKTKEGEVIFFDFEPYDTRPVLIQGITNSRKSSMVEEFIKRLKNIPEKPQQIIFDVEGEFGRLRKYHDGYVIAGDRGEIALDLSIAFKLGQQTTIQKPLSLINYNIALEIFP